MTPKRLLIAEDDAFLAMAYRRTFGPKGLEVDIAENGLQAMQALAKDTPDLLLLDLLMPEMNGLEVLESLAADGLRFPVLVFTNITKEASKKRCLELGAKEYIIKCSVSLEELYERIMRHL